MSNTLQKLPDYKIYYGDTGEKQIEFKDSTGTVLDFTSKDVQMSVSTTRTPAIADAPLFTVTATNTAPTTGIVGFSISDANWATIVDSDFDTDGKLKLFYDVQEKDTGDTTNKFTLGKGDFLTEIDYTP